MDRDECDELPEAIRKLLNRSQILPENVTGLTIDELVVLANLKLPKKERLQALVWPNEIDTSSYVLFPLSREDDESETDEDEDEDDDEL